MAHPTHLLMKRFAPLLLASCMAGSPDARSPSRNGEPWSDPDEYHDRGLSAEMGREYFETIGLGDPYHCGLAYPEWLALLRVNPDLFGTSIEEKFGFLKSDGPLPIGMHLTTDPN